MQLFTWMGRGNLGWNGLTSVRGSNLDLTIATANLSHRAFFVRAEWWQLLSVPVLSQELCVIGLLGPPLEPVYAAHEVTLTPSTAYGHIHRESATKVCHSPFFTHTYTGSRLSVDCHYFWSDSFCPHNNITFVGKHDVALTMTVILWNGVFPRIAHVDSFRLSSVLHNYTLRNGLKATCFAVIKGIAGNKSFEMLLPIAWPWMLSFGSAFLPLLPASSLKNSNPKLSEGLGFISIILSVCVCVSICLFFQHVCWCNVHRKCFY